MGCVGGGVSGGGGGDVVLPPFCGEERPAMYIHVPPDDDGITLIIPSPSLRGGEAGRGGHWEEAGAGDGITGTAHWGPRRGGERGACGGMLRGAWRVSVPAWSHTPPVDEGTAATGALAGTERPKPEVLAGARVAAAAVVVKGTWAMAGMLTLGRTVVPGTLIEATCAGVEKVASTG